MSRERDIEHFYGLMRTLRERLGGFLYLRECTGRQNWPERGVYFFFDEREARKGGTHEPRVVRVGTHGLKSGSSTSLWQRLSQHAGSKKTGRGNHRGSIFRLLVGEALRERDRAAEPKPWGIGSGPGEAARELGMPIAEVRPGERPLEIAASRYIGDLPFLAIAVEDAAGPASGRGIVERNSIALLSNYKKAPIDPATENWLGRHSGRDRVRESGLWNNNHVEDDYDRSFLGLLERTIEETRRIRQAA